MALPPALDPGPTGRRYQLAPLLPCSRLGSGSPQDGLPPVKSERGTDLSGCPQIRSILCVWAGGALGALSGCTCSCTCPTSLDPGTLTHGPSSRHSVHRVRGLEKVGACGTAHAARGEPASLGLPSTPARVLAPTQSRSGRLPPPPTVTARCPSYPRGWGSSQGR